MRGQFNSEKYEKRNPDYMTEERHTYSARVLETFREPAYASIRYEIVVDSGQWTVDSGESAVFNSKSEIVTLCKGPRGFFWPGPGFSFEGKAAFIVEARRAGSPTASSKSRSFSNCL